jgi:pimeloyl-ACP methyl ester carboxylesterase
LGGRENFSLQAWVADLEAVVDAAGLERFALLDISHGGPIVIAYAALHPERVSHLVLYGAYARGRSMRSAQAREEAELLVSLVRVGWGAGKSGVPPRVHHTLRSGGDARTDGLVR